MQGEPDSYFIGTRQLRIACAVTLSIVLIAGVVRAQEPPLSPKAPALKDALAQLQKRPDDRKLQEQYLKAFPHTYQEFLGFFDTGRELADGADYIDVLPSLAKNHEAAVGNLLVQLSKDAQKEADAPTYLQMATRGLRHRAYEGVFCNPLDTQQQGSQEPH